MFALTISFESPKEMAFSKAFSLLGLLFAVLLILSPKVSGRNLAEAAQIMTEGSVEEAKHWGPGGWGFGHGKDDWDFGHGKDHWGFKHGKDHRGFGHGKGDCGFGGGDEHGHGGDGHEGGIPGKNGAAGKVEKETEAAGRN